MPTSPSSKESAMSTDTGDAVISKQEVQHPTEVPSMLTVGTAVSVNKSTLEGTVVGYHLSEDTTTLTYLVDYKDDGEKQQRAFLPTQIKAK